MPKKRPYLEEDVVNEAIEIWKEKHGVKTNFPESAILEDILRDWIKSNERSKK